MVSSQTGKFIPAYMTLHTNGELIQRIDQAREYMKKCTLCARRCRVDRRNELGVCRTGEQARIASYGPHHGEEDPLRGWHGSGTIFFGSCNLRCSYCQNADISQSLAGHTVDAVQLAHIMFELQALNCHNINLVSSSHVIPHFLEALPIAIENGLQIPLVYNSGGYDSLDGLSLLDGVIDIYLPDMKYGESRNGRLYSGVKNYTSVNKTALREMHRQVGDLVIDDQGIAQRGLIIRHLILPNGLAATGKVARFIAEELSTSTYINLMTQYRPEHRAINIPPLNRPVQKKEIQRAYDSVIAAGLRRLDHHNTSC
jgi:putative pyruvate formate lyase activating enzyme